MCVFDWALFANVVTAIATLGLVIVGGFAAKYAYKTANAVIDTFRLESEPILIAGVEPERDAEPNRSARIGTSQCGQLLMLPAPSIGNPSPAMDFTVKNVGRFPAANVTATFLLQEVAGTRMAEFPLFIESLIPQDTFVFRIRNTSALVVTVTVTKATRASLVTPGRVEEARLFTSSALPFPLG